MGLYNRDKAVEYALYYSISPGNDSANPIRFDQDCTNFVSWCLNAGGMKQSDDWYFNWAIGSGKWVLGSYSSTWTVSDDQFNAFSNNNGQFPNTRYINGDVLCIHESKWIPDAIKDNNIQKGDVLYFLNPKTNKMGHTAIIVSVENGKIIYAQHDENKNNGDLGVYLDTHTAKDDYTYVFVVRIRDDA